jgi:hypothetical protein
VEGIELEICAKPGRRRRPYQYPGYLSHRQLPSTAQSLFSGPRQTLTLKFFGRPPGHPLNAELELPQDGFSELARV